MQHRAATGYASGRSRELVMAKKANGKGGTGAVRKAMRDVSGQAVEDMEAKMRMHLARQ